MTTFKQVSNTFSSLVQVLQHLNSKERFWKPKRYVQFSIGIQCGSFSLERLIFVQCLHYFSSQVMFAESKMVLHLVGNFLCSQSIKLGIKPYPKTWMLFHGQHKHTIGEIACRLKGLLPKKWLWFEVVSSKWMVKNEASHKQGVFRDRGIRRVVEPLKEGCLFFPKHCGYAVC